MNPVQSLIIKRCTEDHIPVLIKLGIQTFVETFEAVNTPENMKAYLEENYNTTKLKSEFQEAGAVFFIAYRENEPMGFAKVRTTRQEEGTGPNALEIERLYAVKSAIGTGVGKALMQHCHDYAKTNGFTTLWLGVWEHNYPAIEFYKKWNFDFFGQHIFMLGDDAQTDLLMKKII